MKDFHNVIFLVKIYKVVAWFLLLSNEFLFLYQHYGKKCVGCGSIGWEPEENASGEEQCVEGSSAITKTLGKPLALDSLDK